jgi:hypothetical protein
MSDGVAFMMAPKWSGWADGHPAASEIEPSS